MNKYAILLSYVDKQLPLIDKLYGEITTVDVSVYEQQFVFAVRVQQFYTALEDLFKQTAKSFENHIDQMDKFHKEILTRMSMDIPKIRPAIISATSFLLLDKVRAFRHFIRHAYNCEFDAHELFLVQSRLSTEYATLKRDLLVFRSFIQGLC